MKFKLLPRNLRKQTNNILNKNERLATNIVQPTPASSFDKSHRHLTTFDSSKLVPIFVEEALPGDIFKINTSALIRMSTPSAATMENPTMDIHFFFVPNRIIWENFKYFMGENKNAGYQADYKQIPIIDYDTNLIYKEEDLASYLGFPQGVDFSAIKTPISSLYFKAYGKIWNDYYRDQNLQSEIDITNNNRNDENVKVSNYWSNVSNVDYNKSIQIGKQLAPVSRLVDYFSTCLPYPQKGDTVSIDTLPLKNLRLNIPKLNVSHGVGSPSRVEYYDQNGKLVSLDVDSENQVLSLGVGGNQMKYDGQGTLIPIQSQKYTQNLPNPQSGELGPLYNKLSTDAVYNVGEVTSLQPFNYSINDLRLSIALQHMRELDARGGTRYIEMLLNHFGVQTSDARLDRAELIGGFRDNINIGNIVQSSSGTNTSPLGVLGGVSVTSSQMPRAVNYAVKEHGIIMGFVIVRPQINYSQGLEKKFTRIEKLDFYDPLLANIGEQPVFKYELFLSDDTSDNKNNEIFGYNEAWADYRYSFNKASGYMSVNSLLSLASLYSYTEKYENAPVLGSSWMESNKRVIGQTLLVGGDLKEKEYIQQFLGDFYFNSIVTRKMPVYSIPGLKRI